MDPDYQEHRIRRIRDDELLRSLDLSRPALAQVRAAAERSDYPAAYGAWAKHWPRVAERARFHESGPRFQGTGLIGTRREVTESLRERKEEILATAERILRREIQGSVSVTIQHGPVVDFNAAYGEAGKYGFHYWGWARPLIEAFLLTDDQTYLADFDTLFNQWYEQRHQVKGRLANDVIYYELGLGLRNRVFLEYYCLPYDERPLITHERLLKTVLGAARWLYAEQETKGYRKGNWQVMGSYGLAYIGLMLPEFREAPAWVRLGAERIRQHVEEDFFQDGCHSERCPSSYHLITYRDPRNLAVLLADQPEYADLSARLRPPLERTLDFLLYILTPDGSIPGINDGSRVRPAGYLRDGARLYGREDMRWAVRNLLGGKGEGTVKVPARRSVHFPDSGFTVMRSDWTSEARYLLVNHGPSGGGHSHLDALSFELHAYGQAQAIDAGIGRTYDDPLHGSWYRTPAAHNMLAVEGATLERAAARGEQVVWGALERLDYLAATHEGYAQAAGVTHRRHIAFVRPGYFLVYDVVEARPDAGERPLAWYLHAPVPLAPHGAGWASPAGPGLIALPADAAWTTRTGKGRASVRGIRGFEEDHADIGWIAFDGQVRSGAPASLGVLLYPFPDERPSVRFRRAGSAGCAAHFVVDHPDGTDHLLFGASGQPWESEDIELEGTCALVRCRDDRPVSWAAVQAKRLRLGGRVLLDVAASTHGEGDL